MMDINYNLLPTHIHPGVQDYIEHGHLPGSFLQAVICNDLFQSFGRADEINHERMFHIVSFFYNEAPGQCWGSPKKMQVWAEHNGLDGA